MYVGVCFESPKGCLFVHACTYEHQVLTHEQNIKNSFARSHTHNRRLTHKTHSSTVKMLKNHQLKKPKVPEWKAGSVPVTSRKNPQYVDAEKLRDLQAKV